MDRMAESQGRLRGTWGLPEGGVAINERLWYRDDGEVRAIFYGMRPFYSYDRSDKVNHKFAAVQLIEAGLARQNDVATAFGLSVSTLCRARQRVVREGIGGLVGQRRRSREADLRTQTPDRHDQDVRLRRRNATDGNAGRRAAPPGLRGPGRSPRTLPDPWRSFPTRRPPPRPFQPAQCPTLHQSPDGFV